MPKHTVASFPCPHCLDQIEAGKPRAQVRADHEAWRQSDPEPRGIDDHLLTGISWGLVILMGIVGALLMIGWFFS